MANLSADSTLEFLRKVRTLSNKFYLVCDGAVMPDISSTFSQLDFETIPLFNGRLKDNVVESGPWMVVVDCIPEGAAAGALNIAKKRNVGVLWISDCAVNEMTRHLRSLNIAKLPDGSICYFRHYDPDVLAWLAEKLDGEQAAQLLGSARGIGFASGFAAGAIIERPANLPNPRPGPIMFSHSQILLMEERERMKSHEKIKDFLRFSFPTKSQELSDDQILEFISSRERIAQDYGLNTERQIALWSHALVTAPEDKEFEQLLAEKIKRLTPD